MTTTHTSTATTHNHTANAANWHKACADRLVTAQQAVSLIRRGERIYLSDGSATPLGMIPALVAGDSHLGDNQILHLLTLGDAPYTRPEFAARFRHNALFIGPNVRDAIADGRADYTPVFLSQIPGLIRSGRIRVDAAILALSPPDEDGYCTFGTHIDLAPAVCDSARVLIGAINPHMPRTHGPVRIHVDRFAALVETAHALPELHPRDSRTETEAIARQIAELVPDGATLQMGIGAIPDAVLHFLTDRRELGIHTEMFSDGLLALYQQGAVTGTRKTLHPGKIVTSFAIGTRRLYDFLNDNPQVEFYPSDYVNDPFVIAQNENMIAINTCLEIDLTGQVCSDSIGARFYSGIGGQVDFMRGAARSKGGRPIIALPSTACDGTVSRILPRLSDGAGVVTTRGDVHWVVTEWGAVNLHGKTVRERAMGLISVAHPKFRPWLLAEAKRLNFVYADQLEPPLRLPVYPRQLETRATAADGTQVTIRPVKQTDETKLRDLFYRLSHETVYHRFFAAKKYLPHENVQRFCTIDYERDMTLVAVVRTPGGERVVGWALYTRNPDNELAEVAFVVDDEYQGKRIGTMLVRRLTEIAEARGLHGFTATVLADNTRMLRVFEKCGYPIQSELQGDMVSLRINFEDEVRQAWEG